MTTTVFIDATDFVAAARSWVGVAWHHQGRSRNGIDCAGLPEMVLREAGVLPNRYASPKNYGRLPKRDLLVRQIDHWCERVDEPQLGCLLAIRWPMLPDASHIAIHAGETIIHAYRKSNGVVEHAYRGQWVRWTVGAWRLPGVDYA